MVRRDVRDREAPRNAESLQHLVEVDCLVPGWHLEHRVGQGLLVDLGDLDVALLGRAVLAVANEAQREVLAIEQLEHPGLFGGDAGHRDAEYNNIILLYWNF